MLDAWSSLRCGFIGLMVPCSAHAAPAEGVDASRRRISVPGCPPWPGEWACGLWLAPLSWAAPRCTLSGTPPGCDHAGVGFRLCRFARPPACLSTKEQPPFFPFDTRRYLMAPISSGNGSPSETTSLPSPETGVLRITNAFAKESAALELPLRDGSPGQFIALLASHKRNDQGGSDGREKIRTTPGSDWGIPIKAPTKIPSQTPGRSRIKQPPLPAPIHSDSPGTNSSFHRFSMTLFFPGWRADGLSADPLQRVHDLRLVRAPAEFKRPALVCHRTPDLGDRPL